MVPEQVFRGWEAARHEREASQGKTPDMARERLRVAQERLDDAIAALRRAIALT